MPTVNLPISIDFHSNFIDAYTLTAKLKAIFRCQYLHFLFNFFPESPRAGKLWLWTALPEQLYLHCVSGNSGLLFVQIIYMFISILKTQYLCSYKVSYPMFMWGNVLLLLLLASEQCFNCQFYLLTVRCQISSASFALSHLSGPSIVSFPGFRKPLLGFCAKASFNIFHCCLNLTDRNVFFKSRLLKIAIQNINLPNALKNPHRFLVCIYHWEGHIKCFSCYCHW